MMPRHPQRIVCLTEETTETLYRLGEQDRIVGISGYTVRPPRARREKPRVSAFTSAKIDRILGLQPDLVLAFSDMQADIAAELVRHGVAVHVFNQRSVQQILDMVLCLGAMVGAAESARGLAAELAGNLDRIRESAPDGPRPRVYFEEWPEPRICGIRWVSELIEIAGGRDCCVERSHSAGARGRIIADDAEIFGAQPDLVIGSWCGRKFKAEQVAARAGWADVPAVRDGELHEIKSAEILQPGPAALTDGVQRLADIIGRWRAEHA